MCLQETTDILMTALNLKEILLKVQLYTLTLRFALYVLR